MGSQSKFKEIKSESIPQDLKVIPQWVNWRERIKNGKPTKIPINSITKKWASVNKADTWCDFETAVSNYQTNGSDGIGFVLTKDDPFIGLDIDKCRDPQTGKIDSSAQQIMNDIASYTEISPSGTGIRIFAKGKLPPNGRKRGNIEMYDSDRYLTLTGHHHPGAPELIFDRQNEIENLHAKALGAKNRREKSPNSKSNSISSSELLQKAFQSKKGDKIKRLYNGYWSDFPSQSEADLSLCNHLAFFSENNPLVIDRLFRQSGLFRKKWDVKHYSDGKTYGEMTIQKALKFVDNSNDSQILTFSRIRGGYHLTDYGNAERLVALHGNDIRFCPARKKWYIWNGNRWNIDNVGRIMQLSKKTVRTIYREASNANEKAKRTEIVKHASKSEAEQRIKAMIKLAESEQGIPVLPEELDSDPMLFNVSNGTIDLHTGKLLKHDRKHLITKISPVEFDPAIKAPIWESFLNKIMAGNLDSITYLKRIIGYSLTGNISEQCFFFFYGEGANGKSTFIETIRLLMGDFSKQADFNTFLKSNNNSIRNDIARLIGARFVSAVEADSGEKLDEVIIKRVTGGDTISARFLYAETFEYKPTFKIFLVANNKPVIQGTDEAIWRRVKLIPFTVTICREEQDPQLPGKLKAELSGILNLAIEGCLEWKKHGLPESNEVETATMEYQHEMNTIEGFLSDRCIILSSAKVQNSLLLTEYQSWCDDNEQIPQSKPVLRAFMTNHGFHSRRGGKGLYYWHGIRLKQSQNEEVE